MATNCNINNNSNKAPYPPPTFPNLPRPPFELNVHTQNTPHPTITYHNVPLKRSRSTRACDTCRRKRTKCTGGQPCEGCMAFGLPCMYTAPQKKRGPAKRSAAAAPAPNPKVQTTLGQRLKTVESLLSGLIHGAPASLPANGGGTRPRSASESSILSATPGSAQSAHTDDDDDDYETEDESIECEEAGGGFNGIALAIHRPRGRKLDTARASSVDTDAAPTFCQVPWRQGVTVTDPESGVLVQTLSLNDPSVIAHRFNNNAGNITIVEDVVTDTVLFYGSTVTSNTSALRQSPRFNDGVMSIALRSDVQPANPTISHDSPPCSPDLVHHLVSLYFTHIHPYFPMIDRKSFTRQLKEKQTEHFSLLLNSMCALVTQQTRSLVAWGISSTAELHRAFFERARALLGKQFDWPHINNVQALLLLTLVGAGTNTNAASYQYIGIAHRHAIELGMHRNLQKLNHPGLDETMKEQMRATWFCLYILDRYIGVHQGRPFAINDEDWDTPLPRQEETGDVARMIRHVALCSILGQIANYVNRPSARRRTRASRDQWVREMDEELSSWRSLLPADLASEPNRATGSWSFHHHLHVMYHTAVILLYRIATGRFGGVCIASAVAIRQVLEALPTAASGSGAATLGGVPTSPALHPEYVFVMPIVVYSGLTASTMFLDMALGTRVGPNGKRAHSRRKRSKSGEEGSIKPEFGAEGAKINPVEELKRSMSAFEKLKDISQFSVYYGQLIAECMKGAGMNFAADEPAASAHAPATAASANARPDGMPRIENIVLSNTPKEAAVGRNAMQTDPAPPYPYPNGMGGGAMAGSGVDGPGTTYLYPMQGMGQMGVPPPTSQQHRDPSPYTANNNPNGIPHPNLAAYHNGTNIPIFAAAPNPIGGPATGGPNFGDSIFSELLNPFFDPEATWWGDFGLDSGAAVNAAATSAPQAATPSVQGVESLNHHQHHHSFYPQQSESPPPASHASDNSLNM
ncbi:fungal-specific transcription factor domain-containing protein [Powellomyces hirtus]|nr:fungal-specific transcription factor domain-containing protein [Powellomyces hirtus]